MFASFSNLPTLNALGSGLICSLFFESTYILKMVFAKNENNFAAYEILQKCVKERSRSR